MKNKLLKAGLIVPQEIIQDKIFFMRGKKVMIDRDLAKLYDVETKALNQAVKRNIERFPEDFMFKLTKVEKEQLVTNCDRFLSLKHSTSLPHVFTEHGILMLSSVLNSARAIQVNIQIMRIFTKMRKMVASYVELKHKIEEMERKYDKQFAVVFEAIKQLLQPPVKEKRKIGFHG